MNSRQNIFKLMNLLERLRNMETQMILFTRMHGFSYVTFAKYEAYAKSCINGAQWFPPDWILCMHETPKSNSNYCHWLDNRQEF
jgi:hypothetical protein